MMEYICISRGSDTLFARSKVLTTGVVQLNNTEIDDRQGSKL